MSNRFPQVRQNSETASRILKAMANEHRLIILSHLAEGEKSVSELCALVGLNQSALSQHLARLWREALVDTRPEAQRVIYSLNGRSAWQLLEALRRTLES